ncbi:hypothetical protein B0I31_101338 [Saccharothrix carnea]|uniref:Uncharacterized protein n=1 Tax=Saccharothrix carnea TaxID=1280637 RepID=A0A2P8II28_SACCR|nr:hypothetical protein [Saccharothrix carnea]PSL58122.1 hypothetical protein B0I31_101338 [Saccharothrix carnea]
MTTDTPDDASGRTFPAPVTPAQLRGATEDLRTDALDAPEALKRVWSGLCLARLLGLRLALADRTWQQRQINAESLEHQLAHDLGTSATFADTALTLPDTATPTPLRPDEVNDAVDALVDFSGTARERMLAVAPRASQWHDERVLRHDSLVIRRLAAAWQGELAGYRLESR